jgi:hypothetical protein
MFCRDSDVAARSVFFSQLCGNFLKDRQKGDASRLHLKSILN